MYKCILWGMEFDFGQYVNLLKLYELSGSISVLGVVTEEPLYKEILGYRCINRQDITNWDFDFIIILDDKEFFDIKTKLLNWKVPEERIIPCRVLKIPMFSFEKYLRLKQNPLSIFSPNCWAGLTYNKLGLEFCSPIINMYLSNKDYIKFIKEPYCYVDKDIEFKEFAYDENLKREYPVCVCEDIILHFNHYDSFEAAKNSWDKRKRRICWDNIFVMFFTESKEEAEEFAKLDYDKKICFVPFEMEADCICNLGVLNAQLGDTVPFWDLVNGTVTGKYYYYNILDLLLDAKVEKIVE